MAVPAKPKKKIKDFLEGAATEKKDPAVEETKQLNVVIPADLHATIKRNCSGNMKVFTAKIFREYFQNQGIKIEISKG